MSNFWLFALVVALAIAWFVLDRPVPPGETVSATIVQITPIEIPTGPPQSKLVVQLDDGTSTTLQIPREHKLQVSERISLVRTKRRLSGIAHYTFP